MSVATITPAVADLLDSFENAAPDRLDAEFQRLTGALWSEGAPTALAESTVPALIALLDRAGDDRRGLLAVLLGLLAETDLQDGGGEVAAAVREGLDRYLDLLRGGDSRSPLTLALLYLLSHFPADRDRILAAAGGGRARRGGPDEAGADAAAPGPRRPGPRPVLARAVGVVPGRDGAQVRPAVDPRAHPRAGQGQLGLRHPDGAGLLRREGLLGGPQRDPRPFEGAADRRQAADEPVPRGADIFRRHAGALRCPGCGGAFELRDTGARCDRCATSYPIAHGILDLSAGVRDAADVADDVTADLLQKLAEMPSMGLYYESVLRPAFLRVAGSNWGDEVTWDDEDAYIAEHVRPVDGPVLDLAAGAGRWTEVLARTVGAERVIALDAGLPMLNVLRRRLADVPAVLGDALALPFADASLGAVQCWNALQAFPEDAERVIGEVGRCLRPGGTFTMMTFRFSDDPVERHFQESHHFPSRPEGMLLFDIGRIGEWLDGAGMTVQDLSGPGTFVFVTAVRR
ncbi:class I SAM-dependent methyltransferase [Microbispora sp. GKU 823]|uniref:class I SAM-dependent methyltransferase n=1 Tax=Microbispora sp. GKU 823 TaxID=1652100 RepID=UPI001C4E0873|nr:class I SAM-dependent methyltransferase [Microbispora sp. GKU 823]